MHTSISLFLVIIISFVKLNFQPFAKIVDEFICKSRLSVCLNKWCRQKNSNACFLLQQPSWWHVVCCWCCNLQHYNIPNHRAIITKQEFHAKCIQAFNNNFWNQTNIQGKIPRDTNEMKKKIIEHKNSVTGIRIINKLDS